VRTRRGWHIIDAVSATGQWGEQRARVGPGRIVDGNHAHSCIAPKPAECAGYWWSTASLSATSSPSIGRRASGVGASGTVLVHGKVCMEWIRRNAEPEEVVDGWVDLPHLHRF
jgi:hypothetical protein